MARPPSTLELAHATIVTPVDGSANQCAEQIAHAVRKRCGVELSMVSGERQVETQHVIVLGCLANNPFIEQLYLRGQTLVDRWYPGTGGYVVQMVARAHGLEGCALVLGGSDPPGIAAATAAFLPLVAEHADGSIPWLLKVELGPAHLPLPEDRIDALGTSTSPVPTPESAPPEAVSIRLQGGIGAQSLAAAGYLRAARRQRPLLALVAIGAALFVYGRSGGCTAVSPVIARRSGERGRAPTLPL